MEEAAATAGIGRRRAGRRRSPALQPRDLALGGLGAPGDKIFHLSLGLGRDPLRFGLGRRDDVLSLAFRARAAAL